MDPRRFRALMRRFATGVTMVTAAEDSAPGGVTVNAFAALSLEPPQVLVCLDNGSRTLGQILAAGSFAVNILGARQQDLARRFADKSLTAAQRFAHVPTWPLKTGAPTILGSIAVLDCRLVHTWSSGDHTVLVGEVVDGSADGEDDPLIFYAGGYRQLVARRDLARAKSPPASQDIGFTVHRAAASAHRSFAERAPRITRQPHQPACRRPRPGDDRSGGNAGGGDGPHGGGARRRPVG